ncbi:MAG: MarC family protein [Silvanigrellaceae bacterium]|nr:MarC family protein [Silvanigrellaceae bacterium]
MTLTLISEFTLTVLPHLKTLFNTFVAIFVMVDPFAAVPIYLVLTERFTPLETLRIRRKAVFIAGGILLVCAVTGMGVLNFFGISIPALRISGGILLLKLAFEQMKGEDKIKEDEKAEGLQREDISVVPLAMPLLAGPGAISTVIVESAAVKSLLNFSFVILSIVLAMLVSYYTIKSSLALNRYLGRTGLNLLGKLVGILIAGIAIQFILIGLKESFPKLWQ